MGLPLEVWLLFSDVVARLVRLALEPWSCFVVQMRKMGLRLSVK